MPARNCVWHSMRRARCPAHAASSASGPGTVSLEAMILPAKTRMSVRTPGMLKTMPSVSRRRGRSAEQLGDQDLVVGCQRNTDARPVMAAVQDIRPMTSTLHPPLHGRRRNVFERVPSV